MFQACLKLDTNAKKLELKEKKIEKLVMMMMMMKMMNYVTRLSVLSK